MSTTEKTAAAAEKVERRVEPMGPNGLKLTEHERNSWRVIAAKGVEPADLLEPSYWQHHAGKLAPWDHIEVRAEDGSWYQELVVMDSSRAWARVAPKLPVVRFTTPDVSLSQTAPSEYEVMHRGPRKWSVIRKKDRAVMFEEGGQRDAAETWLKDNSDKLKAGALSPIGT